MNWSAYEVDKHGDIRKDGYELIRRVAMRFYCVQLAGLVSGILGI